MARFERTGEEWADAIGGVTAVAALLGLIVGGAYGGGVGMIVGGAVGAFAGFMLVAVVPVTLWVAGAVVYGLLKLAGQSVGLVERPIKIAALTRDQERFLRFNGFTAELNKLVHAAQHYDLTPEMVKDFETHYKGSDGRALLREALRIEEDYQLNGAYENDYGELFLSDASLVVARTCLLEKTTDPKVITVMARAFREQFEAIRDEWNGKPGSEGAAHADKLLADQLDNRPLAPPAPVSLAAKYGR